MCIGHHGCVEWFYYMTVKLKVTGRCERCGYPLDVGHSWDGDRIRACPAPRKVSA